MGGRECKAKATSLVENQLANGQLPNRNKTYNRTVGSGVYRSKEKECLAHWGRSRTGPGRSMTGIRKYQSGKGQESTWRMPQWNNNVWCTKLDVVTPAGRLQKQLKRDRSTRVTSCMHVCTHTCSSHLLLLLASHPCTSLSPVVMEGQWTSPSQERAWDADLSNHGTPSASDWFTMWKTALKLQMWSCQEVTNGIDKEKTNKTLTP